MVKSGARTMSEYFKKERQAQQRLAKLTFAAAAPADKPTPKKRRRPKSGPAIALLKEMYPPDGRPSEDVSNSALDRKYREECDKREIHKHDRVSPSQLLRCVGRKDEKKK